MPVAIIMSMQNRVPAIIQEDTALALVERLNTLEEANNLNGIHEAQEWLQTLPWPSGWFDTAKAAHDHVQRAHQGVEILSGEFIRKAREKLGMSRAAFADAIGMGGNANTRHKQIHEIENEKINPSSGRPRVLNPNATLRLRALLAEHELAG